MQITRWRAAPAAFQRRLLDQAGARLSHADSHKGFRGVCDFAGRASRIFGRNILTAKAAKARKEESVWMFFAFLCALGGQFLRLCSMRVMPSLPIEIFGRNI